MTIGILTYQNQLNYGGVLQAYSLQKVLQERYPTTQLINFQCSSEITTIRSELGKSSLYFWRKGSQKRLWLHALHPRESMAHHTRVFRTHKFLKNLHQTNSQYESAADLASLAGCDVVIVGSDQVWKHSSHNLDACLLNSLPQNVIRMAYAASLGTDEIPTQYIAKFQEALSKYQLISVREPSGVALLQPLVPPHRTVHWAVDPTILLPQSSWMNMVGEVSRSEEPYVLLYWLGDVTSLPGIIQNLQRNGWNRIKFFFSWYRFALAGKTFSIKWLRDLLHREKVECCFGAGPSEFLSGIANAAMVVTDSFHGMMFATIFEKPIRILPNSSSKRKASQNRIRDFAQHFGLTAGIAEKSDSLFSESHSIDYSVIKERLELERSRSKRLLFDALANIEEF